MDEQANELELLEQMPSEEATDPEIPDQTPEPDFEEVDNGECE